MTAMTALAPATHRTAAWIQSHNSETLRCPKAAFRFLLTSELGLNAVSFLRSILKAYDFTFHAVMHGAVCTCEPAVCCPVSVWISGLRLPGCRSPAPTPSSPGNSPEVTHTHTHCITSLLMQVISALKSNYINKYYRLDLNII